MKSLFSPSQTIVIRQQRNSKRPEMAAKKTMCANFTLAMVVLVALAAMGEARKCMEADGANHEKCVPACEGCCNQTEGSSTDRCHRWACH